MEVTNPYDMFKGAQPEFNATSDSFDVSREFTMT